MPSLPRRDMVGTGKQAGNHISPGLTRGLSKKVILPIIDMEMYFGANEQIPARWPGITFPWA